MSAVTDEVLSLVTLPLMAKVARVFADTKRAEAEEARRKERARLQPVDEKSRDRQAQPNSSWEQRWAAENSAQQAERLALALEEVPPIPTVLAISDAHIRLLRKIDAGEIVHEQPVELAELALAVPRIVQRDGQVIACLALSGAGHEVLAQYSDLAEGKSK